MSQNKLSLTFLETIAERIEVDVTHTPANLVIETGIRDMDRQGPNIMIWFDPDEQELHILIADAEDHFVFGPKHIVERGLYTEYILERAK